MVMPLITFKKLESDDLVLVNSGNISFVEKHDDFGVSLFMLCGSVIKVKSKIPDIAKSHNKIYEG